MSNLNRVTIEGRLTRDPETKFTTSGKRVCSFSVAVNYGTKNEDGTWKNDNLAGFFDCAAWEDIAEMASAFKKGSPVYVEGWLKQDRWTDADGKARSKVLINVREIRMADWAVKAGVKPGAEETLVEVNPEEPLMPF